MKESQDAVEVVKIPDLKKMDYTWLHSLKAALRRNKSKIVLVAENGGFNGILGLTNCLTKEPSGEKIRLVFYLKEKYFFPVGNFFLVWFGYFRSFKLILLTVYFDILQMCIYKG